MKQMRDSEQPELACYQSVNSTRMKVINVHGGGTTGQAGAIALGVTRALAILEPASEQALRDADLMTRDARVKERKKYGRRGARRGFQFSKR